MTQAEADRLVQGIFDGIFDSLTKAEPGGRPLLPASTTVLSLMKPGLAINSSDFRNPWTPGNLNGSQPAAVKTAGLVDDAIKLSGLYTLSGLDISEVYGQMMDGVNVKAQPPNPAIEKQLQDAHAVLYRAIMVTDPETGQQESREVESAIYRDYIENQAVYMAQRVAYMAAYLDSQKTQQGKSTWPLLAPTLQIPVKSAYDKWRANFADKVEQAIAIQNTTSQNALSKAFDKAKKIFEGYGATLEETGTGAAKSTYRSSLLPSDWYSENSVTKWAIMDSASGSFSTSSSSEFTSGGGSAGFNMGLFSVGASGGHSQEHRKASTETNSLRIRFEYTLVTIRRPWMTFSLFGTKGWDLSNLYTKGQISNGSKNNQTTSKMPLLPTSFVVVRRVKISANWSKTDSDFIKKQTSAGASFGIGPFKIGGSYAHSSTNQTFTSGFANGLVEVPGVQILGWISQVVPYSPPA